MLVYQRVVAVDVYAARIRYCKPFFWKTLNAGAAQTLCNVVPE